MLVVHRVISFWFWFLCFWNMSFFVFVLDVIFCVTIFVFIFQDTVWLVNSSWCVHCCFIHQFYWVSDHCGSGFSRWYYFVRKRYRYKLVVSTSFWSRLLNFSSVLTTKKKHSQIFCVVNVLMRCWYADGSWEN